MSNRQQAQVQAQLQIQEKAQTQDQGQAQSTSAPHDRETLQEVASPEVSQTVTDRQARPELRGDLWRVGSMFLCNPASADAFVKAVEIRGNVIGIALTHVVPNNSHNAFCGMRQSFDACEEGDQQPCLHVRDEERYASSGL